MFIYRNCLFQLPRLSLQALDHQSKLVRIFEAVSLMYHHEKNTGFKVTLAKTANVETLQQKKVFDIEIHQQNEN